MAADGKFNMEGGTITGTDYGTGVQVDGTFNMCDGTITDNNYGNGVKVGTSGEFVMSGGKITDNNYGSAVVVDEQGYFMMIDGEITDNDGCGVTVSGQFELVGGEITRNAAGGVSTIGNFTMNGGTIANNTADNGGGVYVYSGRFEMLNASTITGNTANGGSGGSGGGVYVFGGEFVMSGGKITENTASNNNFAYGGGVYVGSGGTFSMQGSSMQDDNNAITENTVSIAGAGDAEGGGVYASGGAVINLSSECKIVENTSSRPGAAGNSSNLYLAKDNNGNRAIVTVGGLNENSKVGVSADYSDTFTRGWPKNMSGKEYTVFITDNPMRPISVVPEGMEGAGELTLAAFHTVSFDPGVEGYTTPVQSVIQNGKASEPTPAPTKTGYTLGGWYTEGGTAWSFSNPVNYNMTLYAKWIPDTYTITFNYQDGSEPQTQTQTFTYTEKGGKIPEPEAPTKDGYDFMGWFKDAEFNERWDFDNDTVFDDGTIILYAGWMPKSIFAVQVVDSDKNPVSDAAVTLKQGSVELHPGGEYSALGYYYFYGVDPGSYNIVVEQRVGDKTKTVTTLVEIDYEEEEGLKVQECVLQMPSDNVSSEVKVEGADTPDVMVGGLEKEAESQKEDGKSVTVTMTVEGKKTVEEGKADAFKAEAGGNKKLEYLDITVEKTVDGGAPTPIKKTNELLTVVVSFPLTEKNDVEVYRYDDDGSKAEAMTKDPSADGECYTLGTDDNLITIYTKTPSTYAIGYTQSSGNNNSGSSGGGGSYSPTTYPVDVPGSIPNGTVSVSPKNASSGTTVTITATPEEGYKTGKVTVADKDGKEISVTDKGNGKYTFTMPAGKVTVRASFVKIGGSYADCPRDYTCPIWPYTDASVTAWYHDGVHYCVENGLMSGYGDNTFKPDSTTTRAMIATILWRLEGSPVMGNGKSSTFTDVPDNQWYTDAVEWAAARGIVGGYGNRTFGPDDPITREQLAAMLYRYEQYKSGGFTGAWMFQLNYTDAELVSSWAYEPMCWTTMNGIINGIGNGLLDPKGNATRAQAAAMIMRFCVKK